MKKKRGNGMNLTDTSLNLFNKFGIYIISFFIFLQAVLILKGDLGNKNPNQPEVLQAATKQTKEYNFWHNSACKPKEKGIEMKSFYSDSMDRWVEYLIFLPNGYDLPQNVNKTYPVIYFLNGVNEHACEYLSSTESNVNNLVTLIKNEEIPPTIIVFPNEGIGLEYKDAPGNCDSTKQCPETMLIKELIPHIDATYRTIASRNGRALEGFSMGGQGTIRLGLRYNTLFCSLGILSPTAPADIQEIENYINNKAEDLAKNMNFKLAAGELEDQERLNTVHTINKLLTNAGIPADKREVSIGAGVEHDLDSLLKAKDTLSLEDSIGKRLAQMNWKCFYNENSNTITPPQKPDTAVNAIITASNTNGKVPMTIQLSGVDSTVQNGSIAEFNWDYGNGANAKGSEQIITYTKAGTYNVTLEVVDTNNNKDTTTLTIFVDEQENTKEDANSKCINDRDTVIAVIDRLRGKNPRCLII